MQRSSNPRLIDAAIRRRPAKAARATRLTAATERGLRPQVSERRLTLSVGFRRLVVGTPCGEVLRFFGGLGCGSGRGRVLVQEPPLPLVLSAVSCARERPASYRKAL